MSGTAHERVAVVVVAGVGDEDADSGAVRIAEGLARLPEWTVGDEASEWFRVEDEGPFEGEGACLRRIRRIAAHRRGDTRVEADVLQFWWADLSRFPAALRSFIAAFLGLFIDMPALARMALRRDTQIGAGPVASNPEPLSGEELDGSRPRRLAGNTLWALGWLIAVPLIIVSFATLLLTGFLALALYLRSIDAGPGATGSALGGVGALVALAAMWSAWRYGRTGRAFVVAVSGAVILCGVGFGAWRAVADGRPPELAIADTLAALVAYGHRGLWLTILAMCVLAELALVVRLTRVRRSTADVEERRRAWRSSATGIITAALAPLGIAVLLTALIAGTGAAVKPLAERAEFTREARTGSTLGATDRDVVREAVRPLDLAAPPPTAVSGAADVPLCLSDPRDWTLSTRGCPETDVGDEEAPVAARVLTAWEWGAALFGQSLAPLIVALCAAAAVVGIAVLAAVWLLVRCRPRRAPDRLADLVRRLVGGVDRLVAPLMLIAVPAASYAGAAMWIDAVPLPGIGRPERDGTATIAGGVAILGVAVALAVVLAKALRLSPGSLAGGGTASAFLRSILDRPYDIATYLREPPPRRTVIRPARRARMPRARMMARYRALLSGLSTETNGRGPYDRLVIVAHSQGSVLSVTLLHDPPGGLPRDVRLVSFGSPLRQTYARRLPRQFLWLDQLETHPWAYLSQRANLTEWVNVAAPGDPLGGTVHRDAPEVWPAHAESTIVAPPGDGTRPAPPRLCEWTLPTGGHTSYWRDPQLHRIIDDAITGRPSGG